MGAFLFLEKYRLLEEVLDISSSNVHYDKENLKVLVKSLSLQQIERIHNKERLNVINSISEKSKFFEISMKG